MKIYITLLLLVLSFRMAAQKKQGTSFLIKGKLQNAANVKLILQNFSTSNRYLDSAITDDTGSFAFWGSVKEPSVFAFGFKGATEYAQIYVENTVITMSGDAKDIRNVLVRGSKENDLGAEFSKKRELLSGYLKDLQKDYLDAQMRKDSTAMKDIINMSTSKWKDSLGRTMVSFVSKHPSSMVSVELVIDMVNNGYNPLSTADGLLRKIESTTAAQYLKTKKIRDIINKRMRLQIGNLVPDFSQPDTTGQAVMLSSFKGKYILVDFWASWCGPCRKENPNMLEAYHKYKNRNFEIVAVSLDENRRQWIAAVKEDQLPWKQLSDLKRENAAGKLYGVTSIPTNYLIDPTGKIVALNLRGENLDKKLQELLK